MGDEPKGFTCECGEPHVYGVYVYAHWQEDLVHTCEKCSAKHNIRRGYATLVQPKKKRSRKK